MNVATTIVIHGYPDRAHRTRGSVRRSLRVFWDGNVPHGHAITTIDILNIERAEHPRIDPDARLDTTPGLSNQESEELSVEQSLCSKFLFDTSAIIILKQQQRHLFSSLVPIIPLPKRDLIFHFL